MHRIQDGTAIIPRFIRALNSKPQISFDARLQVYTHSLFCSNGDAMSDEQLLIDNLMDTRVLKVTD